MEVQVTFHTARARVVLPGGDWFARAVQARLELSAMPPADDIEGRRAELCHLLDNMEGVFLLDLGDVMVEDITLTFMHYDTETGMLVLAVDFEDDEPSAETHIVPFDRLFEGKYDPEEVCLGPDDKAYVIAHVTPDGNVQGDAYVVQPVGEDVPYSVSARTPVPPAFIERLLELVA